MQIEISVGIPHSEHDVVRE